MPRGDCVWKLQRHARRSSQQIGEGNQLSPGLPDRAGSPRFDSAAIGGFGAPTLISRLRTGPRYSNTSKSNIHPVIAESGQAKLHD